MPSRRELENQALDEDIKKIYYESKQRYGAPKIQKALEFKGFNASLKRVQRHMASMGLRSIVVAEHVSVSGENIEFMDEKKMSFWKSYFQSHSLPAVDNYTPPQFMIPSDWELFKEEVRIIEMIAKERSAVIIGRCGSHILRDHPNHISIFIHSSIPFRTERIQKLYNVSEDAAVRMITRSDKDRSYYNQAFTGKDWGDARQYDLSIYTSKTGLENNIKLILNYIELR